MHWSKAKQELPEKSREWTPNLFWDEFKAFCVSVSSRIKWRNHAYILGSHDDPIRIMWDNTTDS